MHVFGGKFERIDTTKLLTLVKCFSLYLCILYIGHIIFIIFEEKLDK